MYGEGKRRRGISGPLVVAHSRNAFSFSSAQIDVRSEELLADKVEKTSWGDYVGP